MFYVCSIRLEYFVRFNALPNIFLSDFGFGEGFLDENGKAKPRRQTTHLRGTSVYMAPGPLMFYTHVRKDDLISLGISMLELDGADLPWMDLPEADGLSEDMQQTWESWQDTDMEVGWTDMSF